MCILKLFRKDKKHYPIKKLNELVYNFDKNYCCKDVRNYAKDFDRRITELEKGGSGGGVSKTYVDQQDQSVLATVRSEIENESNERKQADANEITARESADASLQTNITNESTARENADEHLQEQISALSGSGYRLLFPTGASIEVGESIKYSVNRPFIKLWIGGWTESGNNEPFIFWIDYNNIALISGRNNVGATNRAYFARIDGNSFYVGIKNTDGASRQIKVTIERDIGYLLVIPMEHNDVPYIVEFC